jgi:arylsulfatase A-like enzyme/tetratricopeptide (TPR) repeat protein
MKRNKTTSSATRQYSWLLGLIPVLVLGLFLLHKTGGAEIRGVVLISIDTCRADHLSCYGFPKKTTPHIDRIAEEGVLFENVVTPAPITLPAHVSLLTGLIPPCHGIHDNLNYCLPEEILTLTEMLKANGFRTGAVVSAFVLDARFGLHQGFDNFQDDFVNGYNTVSGSQRRGDETTEFAIQWLKQHKNGKFFLFLHYYDPHFPYDPPGPYAAQYANDPYSGEIAFTDHCIGRVVETLKELQMYDSTLLIIAGDHGEMLGEHGEKEHLFFIYEAALKVPLLVKMPGGSREPARVKETVGLIDVVPTVCSLLNIDIPKPIQGISLEPFLKGKKPPARPRYFYIESMMPTYLGANPLLGVCTSGWKYIQTTRPELYHLETDGREQVNLVKKEPKRVGICKGVLGKILKDQLADLAGSRRAPDRETLDKLASLGYMGANVSRDSFSLDINKPDPKDLIGLHVDLQKVQELKFEGRYTEAKRILEERGAKEPHFKVYDQLGEIAMLENNTELAIANYSRSLELEKGNYYVNLNMGALMVKKGKPQEALLYFQKAVEIRPNDIKALRNQGIVFENIGKVIQACVCFKKVLALDPKDVIALNHMGTAMLARAKEPEAMKYLMESLKVDGNQPVVLARLAQMKTVNPNSPAYDPRGAVPLALEACRLTNFSNPRLVYVLVVVYIRLGWVQEAVKAAEQTLQAARAMGDKGLEQQVMKQLQELKKIKNKKKKTARF